MRVLIAHGFYRIAGGENQYVERQASLLGESHEVKVVALSNQNLSDSVATAASMTYSRSAIKRMEGEIRRFEPDVVHIHNVYPALGPAMHLAAAKCGIPLVATIHNWRMRCPNGYRFTEGATCHRCESGNYTNAVLHHCFPSRRQASAYAMALWIHRFVLHLDDKVSMFVAPSLFVREQLKEWGIDPARVETVRHFVDVPPDAHTRPGKYGLYLGRLSSEKGLEILLQALHRAGDPPFRIAGDGPLADALKHLRDSLGLRNTEFLGWLAGDAVDTVLSDARYVVVPSLWEEPFGLVACESMARGRPVIVSRVGGLSELVDSGGAVAIGAGDHEELASAIAEFAKDDDACVRAGKLGLEFASQEFARDAHRRGLESVYSAVAGSR